MKFFHQNHFFKNIKQTQKSSLILILHDKWSLLLIAIQKKNDYSNLWIFSSLRLLTKWFSRQNVFPDLITSFYARLTPKSMWSLFLRSQTRCNVQNTFSGKNLGFSFLHTTKLKLTPALVVLLFDETLKNLIDLSYLVPKPRFGAILVLISFLVLELFITHNKEGLWNFLTMNNFEKKQKAFGPRRPSKK